MSNEVSNDLIYSTLLDIKKDLGGLTAAGIARDSKLDAHIATTLQTEERVRSLEQSRSRQKGVLATLGAVGSIVGGAIGYAAEYLHKGN